jgi:aminopeptidase-like protein
MAPATSPPAPDDTGARLHALAARLYRLPRSLTGDGVRRSLALLAERIPLSLHEIPSGTEVFDWTVPKEWNLESAYLVAPDGRRIADTAEHNLHLVGYSLPMRARMTLAELRPHLHSLPDRPDWIPYRTSYYKETWGFCLAQRELESLPEGESEVVIDATLEDGALTWGECVLPGESSDEVLISAHSCHPQLANDNLSGMVVAAALAERLAARPRRRYTYRFLFAPGIGALVWLARRGGEAKRVRHGLVAANLGDAGGFHYKRSWWGDAEIDRAVVAAMADLGEGVTVEGFVPFGYDERQFSSPAFRLAVGSLTRSPWGRYPEYHTSADDLGFIRPESLAGALAAYERVVEVLESNRRYQSLNPQGEPRLGKRGLYRDLGGDDRGREKELALLWVLNLADGAHDLLAIAERSGLRYSDILEATRALEAADLLAAVPG